VEESVDERLVGNVGEGSHDSFVPDVFHPSLHASGCPQSNESNQGLQPSHPQNRRYAARACCVLHGILEVVSATARWDRQSVSSADRSAIVKTAVAPDIEGSTMNEAARLNANKAVVLRFNREVIEKGDAAALEELVAADFVNRTALPGTPVGREGLDQMLNRVLRPAFPDLRVEIHDQIAEGDKVTTRKTIRGTHRGPIMGIAATGREVAIEIIDIIRLRDGQYVEHWALNSLASVLAQLQTP
jgi:predicted ester cyclase